MSRCYRGNRIMEVDLPDGEINTPDRCSDRARLHATAAKLANSLGIALYIRDGGIFQTGPGERVDPPPREPASHGRFTIAAAAKP
jgi:hypothetical protein